MSVWHSDLPASQHERASHDGAAILTALTKGVSVAHDMSAAVHALARSAAVILLPGPGTPAEDQDEIARQFAELVRWYIASESKP
jgi:anthranilate/para-aminobenzoate synthase component II